MGNWKSFWVVGYFASLAIIVSFMLLILLTYAAGLLPGQTEAQWTVRLFGALAAGIAIGFLFSWFATRGPADASDEGEGKTPATERKE
jgi:hypothetical protein